MEKGSLICNIPKEPKSVVFINNRFHNLPAIGVAPPNALFPVGATLAVAPTYAVVPASPFIWATARVAPTSGVMSPVTYPGCFVPANDWFSQLMCCKNLSFSIVTVPG